MVTQQTEWAHTLVEESEGLRAGEAEKCVEQQYILLFSIRSLAGHKSVIEL